MEIKMEYTLAGDAFDAVSRLCSGQMRCDGEKKIGNSTRTYFKCTARCGASATVTFNVGKYFVSVAKTHDDACRQKGRSHGLTYTQRRLILNTEANVHEASAKDMQETLMRELASHAIDNEPQRVPSLPVLRNYLQYARGLDEISVFTKDVVQKVLQAKGLDDVVVLGVAKLGEDVVVAVSTPFLLNCLAASDVVSVDGTYYVAPSRSTVVTLGCMHSRAFVPCVFGITTGPVSGETTQHYLTFFGMVKAALPDWEPARCIRDGSRSIGGAVAAVWRNCRQSSCWFHVAKNVKDWRAEVPFVKANYEAITRTLHSLHFCGELRDYNVGIELAKKEWRCAAMWAKWRRGGHDEGGDNVEWTYVYCPDGEAITNCSTERYHRTLREFYFKNQQHPTWRNCLATLGATAVDVTMRMQRQVGCGDLVWLAAFLCKERKTTRALWRQAIQIVSHVRTTYTVETRRVRSYFFASEGTAVTRDEVRELEKRQSRSLLDWNAYMKVRRATTTGCTCPTFRQIAKCKHVFAVRIVEQGDGVVPQDISVLDLFVDDESDVTDGEDDILPGSAEKIAEEEEEEDAEEEEAEEEARVPAIPKKRTRELLMNGMCLRKRQVLGDVSNTAK